MPTIFIFLSLLHLIAWCYLCAKEPLGRTTVFGREDLSSVCLCLLFFEWVDASKFQTERNRSRPCGVHGTKRQLVITLSHKSLYHLENTTQVLLNECYYDTCNYKGMQTRDHSQEWRRPDGRTPASPAASNNSVIVSALTWLKKVTENTEVVEFSQCLIKELSQFCLVFTVRLPVTPSPVLGT